MQYPAQLLPSTRYREINVADVISRSISRTTPSKNFINPATQAIRDEEFHPHSPFEIFDYSTNLLGQFEPTHNELMLKEDGPNKRYYRSYWNFEEEVTTPIFNVDFELNSAVGAFCLAINQIHEQIIVPRNTQRQPDLFLTAIIVHTPSRCNYWHFSIRWIDENKVPISPNESKWKNTIIGTLRSKISILINPTCPPCPPLADEYFKKN